MFTGTVVAFCYDGICLDAIFCLLFSSAADKDYNDVLNLKCLESIDTMPRSAVGNVSGYRCVSDCNSRGRELDPGPVPYFRGD